MKYSFIVTCYNEEHSIAKCLESIINQPFNNFEIIVINDGSTDNSLNIIKSVLKHFRNKKIINIDNNGLSNARNLGVKKSIGQFIMFVDGDDYIDSNYLKIIDSNLNDDINILKFNLNYINENNVVSQKSNYNSKIISGEEAITNLIRKKIVFEPAPLYVFNKNFLKHIKFYFEKGKYHEDFGLIPISITKAKKVLLIDDQLYNYVQTKESITRDQNQEKILKRAYDILFFYDKIIEELNGGILILEETKKILESYYANAVISMVKTLSKNNKKDYILQLEKRKIINKIETQTIKQKFKKNILKILFNLYLWR